MMRTRRSTAMTAANLVISALLAVAVITGIVRAAGTAVGVIRGRDALSVGIVTFQDPEMPPRFEVTGPTPIRYVLDDPTAVEIVLAAAPAALWWLGVVAMLWLLRAIAQSATISDPFQLANVRRLRQLGLILGFGYPAAVIIEGFLTNLLLSSPVWEAGQPSPDFTIQFPVLSSTALLGAVSLFVLAQVFAHGVRLREDVDATV